jgi:protocatechuate 3,4-dioxygenase beta subunit
MDIKGNPIAGAIIETWETDENGLYDTQVNSHRSIRSQSHIHFFAFFFHTVFGTGAA